MPIPTEDPDTVIESRVDTPTLSYTIYRAKAGQHNNWIIFGKCNCCGQCEVRNDNPNIIWTGIPIGQPGAEYDITFGKRKDIPVRPEIRSEADKCTLFGYYLD